MADTHTRQIVSIDLLPYLPIEIVLRIVECLAPSTAVVALKPGHATTQCIRAFTLVCRATYPIATRLLYSHCLYIDRSDRLCQLLVSLDKHLALGTASDPKEAFNPNIISTTTTTLPHVDVLCCLQSLYIAPFPRRSIDDLPTAQWTFELFSVMRHTLRRLVISVPMKTLPTEQDHLNVRPRLHAAFTELTEIEDFVFLDEDLRLPNWGSETWVAVWARWDKLRRLGIRGFDLTLGDLLIMERKAHLETTVIVSPLSVCHQAHWDALFNGIATGHQHEVYVIHPCLHRKVDGLVDSEMQHLLQRIQWARTWNGDRHTRGGSPTSACRVNFTGVAVNEHYSLSVEDMELHGWMRDRAVAGTLLDWRAYQRLEQSGLDQDLRLDNSVESDFH